jgi:hypothetical protein
MLKLEMVHSSCLKLVEQSAADWRTRVGSGRRVVKFGSRLADWNRMIMTYFIKATAGSSLVRQRAQMAEQLRAYIYNIGAQLFMQQVQILESTHLTMLRNTLQAITPILEAAAEGAKSTDHSLPDRLAAADKVMAQFNNSIADLQWIEGGIILDTALWRRVADNMHSVATGYPETYEGQLAAVKKLEASMRRKAMIGSSVIEEFGAYRKGKKSLRSFLPSGLPGAGGITAVAAEDTRNMTRWGRLRRSIGISKFSNLFAMARRMWSVRTSLQLVGMLRPPGYGNLQGYVGYSTGLLGLPLDLLFGFQNDGDSPEVRGSRTLRDFKKFCSLVLFA